MGPQGSYASFDNYSLKIPGSTQRSETRQSWSPKSVCVCVFFWLASVLYQECLHECWEDGNVPTLRFRFYLSILIPLQQGSFKPSLTLDHGSIPLWDSSPRNTQLLPHTMHIWMAGYHISSEVYPISMRVLVRKHKRKKRLSLILIIIVIMVPNICSFTLCQKLFYKLCMN